MVDTFAAMVDEAERYRLSVLRSLALLDSSPEPQFDALAQAARRAFNCPIATLTLVDDDRQWFKARCGIDVDGSPRTESFCWQAVQAERPLVVRDARADPRFAAFPNVTGDPHIRFYAGAPIRLAQPGGRSVAIGTLCVIDTVPRDMNDDDIALLEQLACVAETLIRARAHLDDAVAYAEERREAAEENGRMGRQLAQAERIANLGSWRMTLSDRRVEWSDQIFAIHGLAKSDVAYEQALLYYPPAERARIVAAVEATHATGAPFDIEIDFVAANGIAKRVRSMGELELSDGRPVAMIGVFQDITERYRLEEALRRSATHDELTGLANRAGFDAGLAQRIEAARHGGSPLALALLDLDGFKQVNDTHGHPAGDALLVEVAKRLTAPEFAGLFVARLGGDEFALVATRRDDCARIGAIGERLLDELSRPVDVGSATVAVSGTFGIAWLDAGLTADALLRRADAALYQAKRAGKGRVHSWPLNERRLNDRRRA